MQSLVWGLVFYGLWVYHVGMAMIRVLLVWLLILNPLVMVSTGMAGDAEQVVITHCHDTAPDMNGLPTKSCAGMKCCVFTEQPAMTFGAVGQQIRADYDLPMDRPYIQRRLTRPDKPPRFI